MHAARFNLTDRLIKACHINLVLLIGRGEMSTERAEQAPAAQLPMCKSSLTFTNKHKILLLQFLFIFLFFKTRSPLATDINKTVAKYIFWLHWRPF